MENSKTDNVILTLALVNLGILYYEHRANLGWLPYLGILALLIIGLIFRPIAYLLFIPITGINLLLNTKRIRGLEASQYERS